MKLRIKGNSIRLRLLKSEVERFASDGRISDEISFGLKALRYTLAMSGDESIAAKFADDEIVVSIPESAAREWADGDDVGFEAEQAIGTDETLSIVVEKDFVCLDRPFDPDRADSYPNPNEDCAPTE